MPFFIMIFWYRSHHCDLYCLVSCVLVALSKLKIIKCFIDKIKNKNIHVSILQNSDDWERFLQANQKDPVKVILIHSKSVRVIEAKLKVYKKYNTVIDSSNLFLQHEYDDFENVSKLSVHNKLTWLNGVVETFRNNLNNLIRILKNESNSVLTEDYLKELCQHELFLNENIPLFKNKTLGETDKFILGTMHIIIEKLGTTIFEISKDINLPMKKTNLLQLEFKIRRILIQIFVSNLSWKKRKIGYFYCKEIPENVAREISGKKSDLLKKIFSVIKATEEALKNASRILKTAIEDLKLINQSEGK